MAYEAPLQTINELLLVANNVFDPMEATEAFDTKINLANAAADDVSTVLTRLFFFILSSP